MRAVELRIANEFGKVSGLVPVFCQKLTILGVTL